MEFFSFSALYIYHLKFLYFEVKRDIKSQITQLITHGHLFPYVTILRDSLCLRANMFCFSLPGIPLYGWAIRIVFSHILRENNLLVAPTHFSYSCEQLKTLLLIFCVIENIAKHISLSPTIKHLFTFVSHSIDLGRELCFAFVSITKQPNDLMSTGYNAANSFFHPEKRFLK